MFEDFVNDIEEVVDCGKNLTDEQQKAIRDILLGFGLSVMHDTMLQTELNELSKQYDEQG